MTAQARKRYMALASVLLVVGGLIVACFLWMRIEQQQFALNRELIASLHEGDFKRSLQLVKAGADPNTRLKLPFKQQSLPTWQEFLKQLVSHSTHSSQLSPTAFMLTSGEYYPKNINDHYIPLNRMLDPQLTELKQLMLVHGANVDARDEEGATVLMRASYSGHTKQMAFVLEHGAAVGSVDDNGQTALHYAAVSMEPAAVKMLLKYRANPNLKDRLGSTPLRAASTLGLSLQSNLNNPRPSEVLRLLKAAGAIE